MLTATAAVVLASDAAHYYANMEKQNPFPIVASVIDMIESWEMMRELADSDDHIVPGHDPDVLRRYPRADVGMITVAKLHEAPLM